MTQDYKQGTRGCKSASCADTACVQLGPGGLVKPPPACQTAHKTQGKGQHVGAEAHPLSSMVFTGAMKAGVGGFEGALCGLLQQAVAAPPWH